MSAVKKDNSVLDVWRGRLWSLGVLTTGFLYMAFSAGASVSMSVLLVEFLTYFRESKFTTSWCGSLALVANMASAPLWMVVLNKSSYRFVAIAGVFLTVVGLFSSAFATTVYHLYVSLGLITGFGYGALEYSALLYTSEYFTKRKNLSLGIVSTGAAVGNLVIPVLWNSFIGLYAWRGALILMAAVQCQLAVFSCFIQRIGRRCVNTAEKLENSTSIGSDSHTDTHADTRGKLYEGDNETSVTDDVNRCQNNTANEQPIFTIADKCMESTNKDSHKISTTKSFAKENILHLLRNWRFYAFVSSVILFFISATILVTFNFDYFLSVGISQSDSVILVLCIGIGNVGGRVTGSFVTQCLKQRRPMILLTAYLLCAVSTGLMARLVNLHLYTVLCLLMGASYGLVTTGSVASLLELFGSSRLHEAMSLKMFGLAAGALIGPPLGGIVFDVTQDYATVFTVSMAMYLVAATTLSPTICLPQKCWTTETCCLHS